MRNRTGAILAFGVMMRLAAPGAHADSHGSLKVVLVGDSTRLGYEPNAAARLAGKATVGVQVRVEDRELHAHGQVGGGECPQQVGQLLSGEAEPLGIDLGIVLAEQRWRSPHRGRRAGELERNAEQP